MQTNSIQVIVTISSFLDDFRTSIQMPCPFNYAELCLPNIVLLRNRGNEVEISNLGSLEKYEADEVIGRTKYIAEKEDYSNVTSSSGKLNSP